MDNPNSEVPERIAYVARGLNNFNFDIVTLGEIRRAGEGYLKKEQDQYTFFRKELVHGQPRIHGIGFAIRNGLLAKMTELPMGINERLMTLRI